jgi:hypothetical protein
MRSTISAYFLQLNIQYSILIIHPNHPLGRGTRGTSFRMQQWQIRTNCRFEKEAGGLLRQLYLWDCRGPEAHKCNAMFNFDKYLITHLNNDSLKSRVFCFNSVLLSALLRLSEGYSHDIIHNHYVIQGKIEVCTWEL